jgi:arginase
MVCHLAALAEDNLDCKINDITPETVQHWEDMKNIGCPELKYNPKI